MASTNHEKAVREAAKSLGEAIGNARAAGYAVAWPARPDDLALIEISETGAVGAKDEQATALTSVAVAGRREFGEEPSPDVKDTKDAKAAS